MFTLFSLLYPVNGVKSSSQRPSFTRHLFNNFSLISLSLVTLPITITVVSLCLFYAYFFPALPTRSPSCYSASSKTILVSSLSMSKGLFLARSFYRAGHKVIGLDFERSYIPSSGRFSNALSWHYELPNPVTNQQKMEYIAQLVEIIQRDKIDLWVCVSGVSTTVTDALAKSEIEARTSCKVFLFQPETCETLHEKNLFIHKAASIGLNIPETTTIRSHEQALAFLNGKKPEHYILKSIWLDDVSRGDMTLYPRPNFEETTALIMSLSISTDKPWIFQEFIRGDEYCTHAVIVKGRITAFVACPSSDLLMHYEPADLEISQRLLEFTRIYINSLEDGYITGQVSFDIMVKRSVETNAEPILYPIECNPRTHTAIVLFRNISEALADSYLDSLKDFGKEVCIPDPTTTDSFYWIGHDVITLLLLPLLNLSGILGGLREFTLHFFFWRDATFEFWDPLPFLFLYHVYWPGLFLRSLLTGRRWSRVNVSTGRVFEY